MDKSQKHAAQHFKENLDKINKDWETLLQEEQFVSDSSFLEKMALDIQNLSREASNVETIDELKDKAQLVNFILSTPSGAPFVSETTLLDAAEELKNGRNNDALKHMLSDLVQFNDQKEKTPIFEVFKELSEEIDSSL